MVENSADSICLNEQVPLEGAKWREGNIWLLLSIVVVYFSISFSSRVADYIEDHYSYDNHPKYYTKN
ncbi:MAG: hypothetical protein EU981_00285 [Candidatus Liberibacter ctenarytainae]|uniref:Uncharacterized protein n=1 Tax=Candidatus Liberibacter ctenarytainae TaxID=2020335 RepID=A0A937DKS5_9HYPH|nr:hypothetical protein [Candidatus Liberibacter ctenarytainae]